MSYKRFLIILIDLIILCILSFLSYKLILFYIPFLFAYIISLLAEPMIKFFSKNTSLTRKTCSIITLIIIFSIFVLVIGFIFIKLISETNNLLNGINFYIEKISKFVSNMEEKIKFTKLNLSSEVVALFDKSISDFLSSFSINIKNFLMKLLNYITSLPNFFINLIITILATYFITSDKLYILDRMEHHLSKKMMGKIMIHSKEIISTLGQYLKAELILSFITFIIVLTGLNIFYLCGMNIQYPIIIALIIGFIDSLPILGAGSIMIPWSLISFLNNNASLGFSILGLYIFTLLSKQLLEPKIVSSKIGIHPIFTLFAMYTGYKIIGILGLIIGPIVLIIIKNIFSNAIDKGIINSVIEN